MEAVGVPVPEIASAASGFSGAAISTSFDFTDFDGVKGRGPGREPVSDEELEASIARWNSQVST